MYKANPHAREALARAKYVIVFFKNLLSSKDLSIKVKLLLYKTLIRPILAHSFPAWAHISSTVANDLQIFEIFNHSLYAGAHITPLLTYMLNLLGYN